MSSPPPAEAVVVMDRFVSASSAQDAITSLEQIVDAFKNSNNLNVNREDDEVIWQAAWIFEHEEIVGHLIWLLQHGTLKANESPCEEGVHLVCQLYQMLVKSSETLEKPSPGVLLESLLDILDNSEHPVYVRVLALKVLDDVSKIHKSIAVNQWLKAPNGLHRIADLLAIDVENNPMEEAIRNQALIVAKSLAREAPMAKVFLFAEVDCKLLDLCWKEGGLTKGSPIVLDALELIQEVLKHADTSLQDLVWQRPNVAPRLVQLLDLRGGEEFLHPAEKNIDGSKSRQKNGEDDLDSILASGDGKSQANVEVEDAPTPHLLPSEENVVRSVLNILHLLLETDSVRENVWRHQLGLCSIVWELALVSNPSNPPVCALPTPSLQQEALNLVAEKFNDPATMDRLSGLDRLLYLVCTGGGIAETFTDKLGISQSALAVLRQSLSGDRIHDILMRTLAPPPTEDDNSPPIGPTVVEKLWNTVQENLSAEESEERTLFLSGALGGLGLLLCDEQSREIMFKVAPISLDHISERVTDEKESIVKFSLLRFLCEWICECPFIAHKLLSSTASTNLAGMAATRSDYQSLTHLLLGLAMEYITSEEECGGWTRNGILQIIMKIGISKYTSSLEGLKKTPNEKMPWVISEMEHKYWTGFCRQSILTVRKRVVEELASASGDSDDESDEGDTSSGTDHPSLRSTQEIKPLQKLVSQQTKEIEEMALRLEVAEAKVASQENQLGTWKRRMECTPTELDQMLNEFTSKNNILEERVRFLALENERQKSEKDAVIKLTQDKLSECESEAEKFRKQELEVRDDLQRTEEEMKALSQAYTSLEEEYQRQQTKDDTGLQPPTAPRQLEGEASHEQNKTSSTEVTALKSENTRLKDDARKADEWMSMAVQKMNEIGNANLELENQLSLLKESRAVADIDNEKVAHERRSLETELENEKALRLAAEEHIPRANNIQIKYEQEQQKSDHLQKRITEIEQLLSNYKNIETKMQTDQQRLEELEKRVFEAEEAKRLTGEYLELEKQAKVRLEKQLDDTNNFSHQSVPSDIADNRRELEHLHAEHERVLATKNNEIDALKLALMEKEGERKADTRNLTTTSTAIDEIRQSSQEKIYRLESIIRELEDRLGSELGPYKVDDIQARDEEIEELRKANESAQEWMGKAVEHHNMNSNKIQKLSDENASLLVQLEEERKKRISGDSSSDANDADVAQTRVMTLEKELEVLKREKDANQDLLDELGIAMDDVGVMQQQLSEYKTIKSDLETKLSENVLSKENNDLKSANENLQKRLDEFQEWAHVAQNKIGDIMTAKDEIEGRLQEVTQEVNLLQEENVSLKSANAAIEEEKLVIEQLHEGIKKANSENEDLRSEQNTKDFQLEDLKSQYNNLLLSFQQKEEEIRTSIAQKNILENDIVEERNLSSTQSAEIEELKGRNAALLNSLEELKSKIADSHVPGIVNETNTGKTKAQSIIVPTEEANETRTLHEGNKVADSDDNNDLGTTKPILGEDELFSHEDASRKWQDKVLQLESELENIHEQMQEQEKKAQDTISKLQLNAKELEEKCFEMESNLNGNKLDACSMNGTKDERNDMESSATRISDNQVNSKAQGNDDIEGLRDALKAAHDTLAKDEEIVHQWEERTAVLETKIESLETELHESELEANAVISQWQDSCTAAEHKCAAIEEELRKLKEENKKHNISTEQKHMDEANYEKIVGTLAEKEEELRRLYENYESSEHALQKLKDDVLILNRQIESMSEEHLYQRNQAKKSLDELQQKLDSSEQEKIFLKSDLLEAKSKMSELQQIYSGNSNNSQISLGHEERITELSNCVAKLEDQLKEQEQDALDTVEQWQSACSDLETKCLNLEYEIKEYQETLSARCWSIEQLRSCNESYLNQTEDVKVKISKIEENLANSEAEYSRLLEAQENERKKSANNQLLLQADLEAQREKTSNALNKVELLTSSIEEIKRDAEDKLNQWTVKCKELECALNDAQEQLEEQENDANDAIERWEIKSNELEKELDVTEDQLQQLHQIFTEKVGVSHTSIVVTAEKILRENTNMISQLENAKQVADEKKSQIEHLEREKKEQRDILSANEENIEKLKIQRDELMHQLSLKSEDKLEEERDRLIGIVAQLEEELREANSVLQACVTDGSIDKASEYAANAIRDDIYNMRDQLNEYKQRLEDEMAAREVADLEIERLRDDIASILSLSEREKSPTNIKHLTTKSIEKLQKLQHSEIDDLRKSLFRALDELESTRSTERNTNETVSKLRLQISMYEQEIIAAKSEVNFLSEAMEELRQTEDSKRVSLEYRIKSLENENSVVRKYQATELDAVRNELAQITIEKDVALHKLKETEKTNASLVLATSKEVKSNGQQHSDLHSECVKLRIENAHLLTIASEDKGKAERRLRELLSAQVASSELDVILEHERRVSAETALEMLKQEMCELRNEKHSENIEKISNHVSDEELQDLRMSLEKLKGENSTLKATIENEASKTKQIIDNLTDECRNAQAKAFKFDRDTRTELAVQSEISKMRLSTVALPGDIITSYENQIDGTRDASSTNKHDTNLPSAEAFDLIMKQQKEIQEERIMFNETLQEHEDLLALVAQQDLEKSCLREALVEIAGDDVANDALKRAEEFAIIRYGTTVEVSN